MQSDYLWVRNAPVEEGLKVRYGPLSIIEIMDFISCTTEPPTASKDYK